MVDKNAVLRSVAKRARVVAATLAVSALALTSCTETEEVKPVDHFGYAVGSPLLTTNAQSLVGASTNSDVLAGRLFPPVFVSGPSGQMIPNRDLATAQMVPGAQTIVKYEISEKAQYSDQEPVTCTDFLLAYKAGSIPSLFGSRSPLMQQVETLDCTPGSKKFEVVFKPGMGSRWRQLFGPGTVVPAHVIGQRLGLNDEQLVALLQSSNRAALMPVAKLWNQGFDLKTFDPELQVSAGPYRIESVQEDGSVLLVRNEHFGGDAANIERVMMWPHGTDLAAANETGSVEVADLIGVKDIPWVNRDDPKNHFRVEHNVGHLTELLALGNAGIFANPPERRAFAACVNQQEIARISSEQAGVDVPAMTTRLTNFSDPANAQLEAVSSGHVAVNMEEAELLRDQTVRVGYTGPDPRKQAMVAAISASCAKAGINVVDASSETASVGDVMRKEQYHGGDRDFEGTLDAFLFAEDPHQGYGHVDGGVDDVEKLRHTEQQLWDETDTIPLAAQPRTIVFDDRISNVVANTLLSGIGWNMERWAEGK